MGNHYAKPNIDEPTYDQDDPIIKRLKEQLIDIKRDIDLNYSRCHYKNPLIKIILKNLLGVLFVYIRTLEQFETAQSSDKPFTANEKFSFGTTKKSIE